MTQPVQGAITADELVPNAVIVTASGERFKCFDNNDGVCIQMWETDKGHEVLPVRPLMYFQNGFSVIPPVEPRGSEGDGK